MIKAHEAMREAMNQLGKNGEVVTSKQIFDYIKRHYPKMGDKKTSIMPADCCINTKTAKNVKSEKFLSSVARGKFVLVNEDLLQTPEITKQIEQSCNDISTSITLENDLEEHLVKKLDQIEDGLRLYKSKDDNGQDIVGRQFIIGIGRIDILAIDKEDNFVVIELKAGNADYKVVGQILGYIGWIKKHIADGKRVRGIIIANDFDEKIKYSFDGFATQDIKIKKYSVNFTFNDVAL